MQGGRSRSLYMIQMNVKVNDYNYNSGIPRKKNKNHVVYVMA